MIRKNKDLNDIPRSLSTEAEDIITNPARTTNERRLELIAEGKYIKGAKYDERYKTKDIKEKLKLMYPTCCFCGVKDQQLEVEHYRPKSLYYWLAYSWDNLLYSCTKCNKAKLDKFEILGSKIAPKTDNDTTNINCLSDDYDVIEKPLLINPEKVTAGELSEFIYTMDGHVSSDHPRVRYTINTCGLDRPNLVESRKAIWDEFTAHFNDRILNYHNNPDALYGAIDSLIRDFVNKAKDESSSFAAFRRYAVNAGWIQTLADAMTVE